jgi:hypothetical protein
MLYGSGMKRKAPPTAFYAWVVDSGLSGIKMDEKLSLRVRELDPAGKGLHPRTIRRIRYGERSDSKGIRLLMAATGLPFEAFLPLEWLARICPRPKP